MMKRPALSLEHRYRGARAMVVLHETHMRRFLARWRRAKEVSLDLPITDDPDYVSLESLLRHVVSAARGYMMWMCASLDLPDPQILPAPDVKRIESGVDDYVEHLLARWRAPLRDVPEERFDETFPSPWGPVYCIDAMLEHAVMHPIRHAFQLEDLLGGKA